MAMAIAAAEGPAAAWGQEGGQEEQGQVDICSEEGQEGAPASGLVSICSADPVSAWS